MSTSKGKTQTDLTDKETSKENSEQIEQNTTVTVDPETLTLEDWLNVQRTQLEGIPKHCTTVDIISCTNNLWIL